jgi:hypothetical protein
LLYVLSFVFSTNQAEKTSSAAVLFVAQIFLLYVPFILFQRISRTMKLHPEQVCFALLVFLPFISRMQTQYQRSVRFDSFLLKHYFLIRRACTLSGISGFVSSSSLDLLSYSSLSLQPSQVAGKWKKKKKILVRHFDTLYLIFSTDNLYSGSNKSNKKGLLI